MFWDILEIFLLNLYKFDNNCLSKTLNFSSQIYFLNVALPLVLVNVPLEITISPPQTYTFGNYKNSTTHF
jgi:hypothetical protein